MWLGSEPRFSAPSAALGLAGATTPTILPQSERKETELKMKYRLGLILGEFEGRYIAAPSLLVRGGGTNFAREGGPTEVEPFPWTGAFLLSWPFRGVLRP